MGRKGQPASTPRQRQWMDKSAQLGKAMRDKADQKAHAPRPDWMDDPSLLPKRPPGKGT